MSAIAHFAGTSHLTKAGFLKGSTGKPTEQVPNNKRNLTTAVGGPPVITPVNHPPVQPPPAKSIKIHFGAASSTINNAHNNALLCQSSVIDNSQLSDYYWSGGSTGTGQNRSNVGSAAAEMGNNTATLPYTNSSHSSNEQQQSYGMSYSAHS